MKERGQKSMRGNEQTPVHRGLEGKGLVVPAADVGAKQSGAAET